MDTMTLSGTMTNENCELDNPHFEIVMRRQLKLYVQRQLANAMEVIGSDNRVRLLLGFRRLGFVFRAWCGRLRLAQSFGRCDVRL